jgi:HSP20 family molecular chaperone IbpA
MSDLVDTNKIKASFKKGVLAVTLSKRAGRGGLKERSSSKPVDPFLSEGHE